MAAMTERLDDMTVGSGWAEAPAPADAEALRNLVQAYAVFTDGGAVEELATLFAADAEWDGTALGFGVAIGPAAIAQLVAGHHRPDAPMAHLTGPPLLVARTTDEVDGRCWAMARRWADGELSPTIYFSYSDRFVRGAGGWRFQRRVLRATFPAA